LSCLLRLARAMFDYSLLKKLNAVLDSAGYVVRLEA
jgi:hypothetical protein